MTCHIGEDYIERGQEDIKEMSIMGKTLESFPMSYKDSVHGGIN